MKKSDRQLGMHADISRRDFLNGMSVAIAASTLPNVALAQQPARQDLPGYYPPALTGMRGSHPGSFESAHQLGSGTSISGGNVSEFYDLVVVGGGISGLAAAYFYQQEHGSDARILILDNHDDFGGHAKRNEFELDGENIIGYGGTMFISSPGGYPSKAKQLLLELGIDTEKFYRFFDRSFYSSLNLKRGFFLDEENFGADFLAAGGMGDATTLSTAPIAEKAKQDLVRLFNDEKHYLPDMSTAEQIDYLRNKSYLSYLREDAGIHEDALKVMLAYARNVWAVNTDAFPAWDAWYTEYPGFGNLELESDSSPSEDGVEAEKYEEYEEEPNIFHFPDGNASIARLLVRKMIPHVASGNNMEDIVAAKFDYNQLDRSGSAVRIRLNSTVARVQHLDNNLSNSVAVSYIRDGKTQTVESKKVVMACYNQIIPHLCPEMPNVQKSALSNCVRSPLVYTNVLIRNWQSFVNLGIYNVYCPGSYHHGVALDYPVSMGGYEFSKSPDQPIVLHLTRVPGEPGLSAKQQFDAGKADLLSTSFETFERNVRSQLQQLLGPGGFDAARDIAGITVNRWPHGYAYAFDPETDQIAFHPSSWPENKRVWVAASKQWGNISIASTDSASNAMTESAIEEAFRAATELS